MTYDLCPLLARSSSPLYIEIVTFLAEEDSLRFFILDPAVAGVRMKKKLLFARRPGPSGGRGGRLGAGETKKEKGRLYGAREVRDT
jgi:hypothetical protein